MQDLHATVPTSGRLLLQEVGVAELRKSLVVQRPERNVTLSSTFAAVVDLPEDRKGSDLSRNAELLAEIVDETVTRPVTSLEAACSKIARALLERHAYATRSTVTASAEYFLSRGISEPRRSLEDYRLFATGRAERRDGRVELVDRTIGAEAVGMTACPCAMETSREALAAEFPLLRDPSLRELPIVTHNQRNRTRLDVTLPEGAEVEADRLIEAIEAAQSSPTYAILKRSDEARVVLAAHRNPKFVEDVLRGLLSSLPTRFPELPDGAAVHAATVSEESIHKYNVVADHRTTLGALRRSAPA